MRGGVLFAIGFVLNATVLEAFPPPSPINQIKKESAGALDQVAIHIGGRFDLPALWGQQFVGADFSKEAIRHLSLEPVHIVVSDGGGIRGATGIVEIPLPPPEPRGFQLRITRSLPIAKKIPLLDKAIRGWNRMVPERIILEGQAHPTHATHVAGLIGAQSMDFSVSNYARVEDLDIFRGNQTYRAETLQTALQILIERSEKTHLINMSHGLVPEVIEELKELVDPLGLDTLISVASGNEAQNIALRKAIDQVPELVVVGSYGIQGIKSSFSNYGKKLDLVAPGEFILSRGRGLKWESEELQVMSGTSFATPIVSGGLATLRALLPEARSQDLQSILFKTAIDLGLRGHDDQTGYGLTNIYRATLVALKFRESGLTSKAAISEAVEKTEFYDSRGNNALIRQTKTQRYRVGMASPAYLNLLRKEVLLTGRIENFAVLGKIYANLRFKEFADGLEFAALNRPSVSIDALEMEIFAKRIVENKFLQVDNLQSGHDLFMSLANPDLMLEVYRQLPCQLVSAYSFSALRQMSVMDAERTEELKNLIAEREKELCPEGFEI